MRILLINPLHPLIGWLVQLRPRALWRLVAHGDPKIRHAIRWYYRMGRRVWFHEIWSFLVRDRRVVDGPTLAAFWGAPQDAEEEAMHVPTRVRPEAPVLEVRRPPAVVVVQHPAATSVR